MEPLSFVRSWIEDLNRIGRPVSVGTAREAERVAVGARAAGLPPAAAIALARRVIRSSEPDAQP